ncbi:unnamed protein product (macronuclear) [Paramecium tetraurelia]|uniref:Uncharacterized protein n=1 Tax=Paramecium tetraurelia TaxID=5888 RepID=A0CPC4_PARTE|nr:uncharacterized protein GSPATT00009032001 [Paramecium tetraurelia]CAK72641.1 unnamed protein product [Paramecium tetraurelia]|eukprot:XP_001440038.1 hypothetical protein (macronuclear) [Paramecium tetraurelia strain d4-2]
MKFWSNITRIASKIKEKCLSLIKPPDPLQGLKEQLQDINQMEDQYQEIKNKLDELSLESQETTKLQNEDNQIPKGSENYKIAIKQVYSTLTKKQREFYNLLTEEEYYIVLAALKTPQYSRLKPGVWLNDEIIK